MNDRNNTIDIAKALGIILVVLGHSWLVHGKGEVFKIIFSFHMPLFFFLAGIFINEKHNIIDLSRSKADTLLKPYFVTLLLFGLLKTISATVLERHSDFNLNSYIGGVFYATGNTMASGWVALWFLPHLFLTSLITIVLLKIITYKLSNAIWWIVICAALLLTGGIYSIRVFWAPTTPLDFGFIGVSGLPGLPWSADLIPITSAYIISGYLLRRQVTGLSFNMLGFIASTTIFFLLHYYYNETIDLNFRIYGNPIISTMQAFLGIYIILNISSLLSKLKFASAPIAYVGSGSLFILIFHYIIQEKAFIVLSKFSPNLFANGIVCLALGITMPLLLLEYAKRKKIASILLLPRKINRITAKTQMNIRNG